MKALVISSRDNVAIVLKDIVKGEELDIHGLQIIAAEDVPYPHKIALQEINEGEAVIKYGENIAVAAKQIKQGEWVHTHNILTDGSL